MIDFDDDRDWEDSAPEDWFTCLEAEDLEDLYRQIEDDEAKLLSDGKSRRPGRMKED